MGELVLNEAQISALEGAYRNLDPRGRGEVVHALGLSVAPMVGRHPGLPEDHKDGLFPREFNEAVFSLLPSRRVEEGGSEVVGWDEIMVTALRAIDRHRLTEDLLTYVGSVLGSEHPNLVAVQQAALQSVLEMGQSIADRDIRLHEFNNILGDLFGAFIEAVEGRRVSFISLGDGRDLPYRMSDFMLCYLGDVDVGQGTVRIPRERLNVLREKVSGLQLTAPAAG